MIEAGELGRITFIRLRQAHDWSGAAGGAARVSDARAGRRRHAARQRLPPVRPGALPGRSGAEVFCRTATLKFDIELEDTAAVSLLFESGALGQIETAWTATGWDQGFWVDGTRGALEYSERSGRPILRHVFRDPANITWDDPEAESWQTPAGVDHTLAVASFLAAIRGRRPVSCTGRGWPRGGAAGARQLRERALGQPVSIDRLIALGLPNAEVPRPSAPTGFRRRPRRGGGVSLDTLLDAQELLAGHQEHAHAEHRQGDLVRVGWAWVSRPAGARRDGCVPRRRSARARSSSSPGSRASPRRPCRPRP